MAVPFPKSVVSFPAQSSGRVAPPSAASLAEGGGSGSDARLLVLVRAMARQAARQAWGEAGDANPDSMETLP